MEDDLDKSKKKIGGAIKRPDLGNKEAFDIWLDEYVQKSLGGLEDKSSVPSREEQIRITKNQLRVFVEDFQEIGRSDEQIKDELVSIAELLQDDGKEGEKS